MLRAGAVDWLNGVGSHDHLCSIYQTDAQRDAVALPFLRIGLGRGEKCVYLHSDGKPDDIAQALAAGGGAWMSSALSAMARS